MAPIKRTENRVKEARIERDGKSWIKWIGNFTSASGYSEGIRAMMKGLYENKLNVSIAPQVYGRRVEMKDDVREIFNYYNSTDLQEIFITLQTMPPPSFSIDVASGYNIGRTADESSGIPEEWVDACNKMDEIWVPSAFNRNTFIGSGVACEKVFVIPDAIDLDLFKNDIKPLKISGKKGFNFLSIFDWKLKKGWDVLIKSFVEEFTKAEDVALVIRTFSFMGPDMEGIKKIIKDLIKNYTDKSPDRVPDIIFIEKMLDQHEMAALYKACDSFVLPTRGEGWGRPFMEAMAMELPVIGTDWGGHLEYMDDSNSFLIESKLVDVPPEGYYELPSFRKKKWAEPSIKHLRELMRTVYEDRKLACQTSRHAMESVKKKYNSRSVGEMVAKRLKKIKTCIPESFRVFFEINNCNNNFVVQEDNTVLDLLENEEGVFIDYQIAGNTAELKSKPSDGFRKIIILIDSFKKAAGTFPSHLILILNNSSALYKKIRGKCMQNIVDIKYNADDIWVMDADSEDLLRQCGISGDIIFNIDSNSGGLKSPGFLKSRLLEIKKRPIRRYLEESLLKRFKEKPDTLYGVRSKSILTYSDPNNTERLKDLVLGFIDVYFNDRDISLIISTKPGKAEKAYASIERILDHSGIDEESIPDIIIYDEVLNREGIMRLVNESHSYLLSQSLLDDSFIEAALRLDRKIISDIGNKSILYY